MLQLPESSRRSRRSTRGLVTSVVLHAVVIGVAAFGTARATDAPAEVPDERVVFRAPPPAPAPPTPRAPAPPASAPARTSAPTTPSVPVPPMPTPVEVPDLIAPPGPATLPPDFFERRALGGPPADGVPGGRPGGTGIAPADGIWSSNLVEREVVPLGGAAPRYPETLRGAGVEGEVIAEFVVDTTGRVEPATVTFAQRAHPLFEQAVRQALRGMRFRPAEAGGRTVRQLVRQPFVFALQR
jgi:protein TonB